MGISTHNAGVAGSSPAPAMPANAGHSFGNLGTDAVLPGFLAFVTGVHT